MTPDRSTAAEAITAQATGRIDFPAVSREPMPTGSRFPGNGAGGSCTRLIDRILGSRPHLADPACLPGRDAWPPCWMCWASLVSHRVPVDLDRWYPRNRWRRRSRTPERRLGEHSQIVIEPGSRRFSSRGIRHDLLCRGRSGKAAGGVQRPGESAGNGRVRIHAQPDRSPTFVPASCCFAGPPGAPGTGNRTGSGRCPRRSFCVSPMSTPC